jgi:hypothetical protein
LAHHHGRKPGHEADRQRMGYDYGRGAYYMKRILTPAHGACIYPIGIGVARRDLRDRTFGRLRRELVGGARYVALWLAQATLTRTPSNAIPDERGHSLKPWTAARLRADGCRLVLLSFRLAISS